MTWICAACTFGNADARTICEMCGSPKPRDSIHINTTNNNPTITTTTANIPIPNRPVNNNNNPSPSYIPTESDINYLTSMGFTIDESKTALKNSNGNKQVALDLLIAQAAKSPTKQAVKPPTPTPAPATGNNNNIKPISFTNIPTTKAPTPTNTNKPNITNNNTSNVIKPSQPAATTTTNKPTPVNKPPLSTTPVNKPPVSTTPVNKPTTVSTPLNKPNTTTTPTNTTGNINKPPTTTPATTVPKPAVTTTTSNTIKPSVITPTATVTQPTTAVSTSKPITINPNSNESKAEEAARLKREAERERLFKKMEEEKKSETENKEKAVLAEAEALKEALKQRREAEEKEKRLKSIEKEKQLEAAKQTELMERKKRREAEESKLIDIPTALNHIKSSYDVDRYHALINLLIKILTNIRSDPNNEKFRTIKTSNDKIQKLIIRPVGGFTIMKSLGFLKQENKENNNNNEDNFTFYMPQKNVNNQVIEKELKRLQAEVAQLTTIIPATYSEIDKNKSYSIESVYFASVELFNILGNVTADPEAKDNLQIDLHSRTYVKRLKPIPEIIKLIDYFGFKPEPHGVYLVVTNPDIKLFEAGKIDLQKEIQARAGLTPIFKATQQLLVSNKGKLVKAFIEGIQSAAEKVISEPHEQKYHKIKLDKFYGKIGGEVVGGNEYFELMGFDVDPVTQLATLPYPGFDHELLKLRREDSIRGWKYALEVGRQRREAES